VGSSGGPGRVKGKKDLQSLFDLGMIEVEPLTYIRGRSMPNQYLIVDEAQNLTPHEIKTIITRAGEGTKVVLTGDPYQIDNPYIDSSSNGLTYVVDRFKEESIAGHITLVKGERSDLAELAATLL
jgi:PhoH-like ATPase